MSHQKRWVLLEHIGHPNDLKGIHFDFLVETDEFCRTWRLSDIPVVGGHLVSAISTANHQLYWLERKAATLSGGRGSVKRLEHGFYIGSLPVSQSSRVFLELHSQTIVGQLEIVNGFCRVLTLNK